MANPIVRIDRMSGTTVPTDVETVVYDKDIFNGEIVGIGELVAGERYIREALVPEDGMELGLVSGVEVMKPSNRGTDFIGEFYNEADEPFRVHTLVDRGEFSVTKNGVTGGDTAAVGNVAFLPAGATKISVGATANGIEFGKVMAIEGDFIVFRIKFPVA